jgi:hypothetical protein
MSPSILLWNSNKNENSNYNSDNNKNNNNKSKVRLIGGASGGPTIITSTVQVFEK